MKNNENAKFLAKQDFNDLPEWIHEAMADYERDNFDDAEAADNAWRFLCEEDRLNLLEDYGAFDPERKAAHG
jgi:hypothetical protein